MRKIFLAFFLLCLFNFGFSQTKPTLTNSPETIRNLSTEDTLSRGSTRSTSNEKIKNLDAKIEQYLIISAERDTTIVDTSLTIQRYYKFNYLRRDNFGLMPFNNVGRSYNSLNYDFESTKLMPQFGARARHFNYMEIEDINYYDVPTPLTELYFKTAFEQGQQVDAFFTVNTSRQLNFSLAYKGLRSLGKYQHALTSTGNFRFTTSYKTKNKRYIANAHIVMQDLLNEENGGLIDSNIEFFESGAPEFRDRAVLAVNFENAENILEGKRFHLDHQYHITKPQDSSANNLNIRHIMSLEDKFFEYRQTKANEYFGTAFIQNNIKERVTLEDFYSQLQLNYNDVTLGSFQVNVGYDNYNYGYDKVVRLINQDIPNRLKGDVVTVGGKYKKQFGKFLLKGELQANVSGDFDGNYFLAQASYPITKGINLSAKINHSSRMPNYNQLLYQSSYRNYNWSNNFKNLETQKLEFKISAPKIANITVDATTINNYTYFKKNKDSNLVKPFQNDKTINYIKVKLSREFKLGKFALDNTIMYQKVDDDNAVLNVPELVTRNTLYYSDYLFKKALFLQTGVTFNYFSKYHMNAYDPLLAEFYVQTNQEYGGFPRFDFFINARVQQARIYLKAEHFNAAWTGYDFYSAPNYPYRDFVIRFGLVWNFFL
ncbi:putative porin [Corallibacter vietnamensis]|uniref:Porin n=1 Tax=Corallibacter vietnamensis TaxID=904130 RepID=A0ABP7GQX5_9FLAO